MDSKVANYINKAPSPQKEICLTLRQILLKTLPRAKEAVKWGVLAYNDGRLYIAAVKYGVNFGFSIEGLSNDEIGMFEGSGKTVRNIKIESLDKINEEELIQLIKLVSAKSN